MKLLRYGPPGGERPAILDARGRLRELSGLVADISVAGLGDETMMAALARLDPERLPLVAHAEHAAGGYREPAFIHAAPPILSCDMFCDSQTCA